METSIGFYALTGVALFFMGVYGLVAHAHSIRKILAMNVMGAGVFMVFISMAARAALPDAVPQAMVLTGIVVAVSATALALALSSRLS
jgi:multicomponent Na+:H+ antiporter subunit C